MTPSRIEFEIVEDAHWPNDVDCRRLEAAVATVGELANSNLHGQISIVFSDDATIRRLNRDHRGRDKTTNVLSFPLDVDDPNGSRHLGDVVLARETVVAEAEAMKIPLMDHICHLVVHAILHIAGYDHETDAAAAEMEQLETRVLATLGIADPHAAPLETEESHRTRHADA